MGTKALAIAVALFAACTKVPTKEKSSAPPFAEPSVTAQPDPGPVDAGSSFDAASFPPPIDAGCPDAMPEASADCDEWVGSYDCHYVDDGGDLRCQCNSIPEGTWWSCGP
jgi:hypothetical protein